MRRARLNVADGARPSVGLSFPKATRLELMDAITSIPYSVPEILTFTCLLCVGEARMEL